MSVKPRTLKTLELDKILELLKQETALEDAARMALEILPATDAETVETLLKNTEDAYIFMAKYQAPSFSGAKNVANSLRRAQSSAVLSIKELLDIAETLRVIRVIKEWRNNCLTMENTSLEDYFLSLYLISILKIK